MDDIHFRKLLRYSQIAFYRERGETYAAIGKRYNLSRTRIHQIMQKYQRIMLAWALHSIKAKRDWYWTENEQILKSDNMEETKAIFRLLKQLAERRLLEGKQ